MTVHCCGCRGPSVLRGPVELLEEAVPDELCPPGEGKDGLLYGRHPSSGDRNEGRYFTTLPPQRKMHERSETAETKSYLEPPDICRAAVPTGFAKQKGVPRRTLRRAASMSYDEGKIQ